MCVFHVFLRLLCLWSVFILCLCVGLVYEHVRVLWLSVVIIAVSL